MNFTLFYSLLTLLDLRPAPWFTVSGKPENEPAGPKNAGKNQAESKGD